ncbi:MAG: HIT domain-containing protein [Calditrichia bacterium]
MERIWAPWRMEYIDKAKIGEEEPCFFCEYIRENKDEENLILYRGQKAFIIMNRFPYNNGHLMVVPYEHSGDVLNLSPDIEAEMFSLIQLSVAALTKLWKPHGFNIGMNLGRVAGAGVADHLHYHIVPRWQGDTNFMPVLADTKVISEALKKSYEKLSKAIQEIQDQSK